MARKALTARCDAGPSANLDLKDDVEIVSKHLITTILFNSVVITLQMKTL